MATTPHILHVDDCADDRELFARAFVESGCAGILQSVGSTVDGMFFLRKVGAFHDAQRPQLIVLDLNLPNFDGIGFLELLRRHTDFKTIPVIVLSGSESHADMQRCRELGVVDYLVKPKTQQGLIELIASLSQWLGGSSTGQPATHRIR